MHPSKWLLAWVLSCTLCHVVSAAPDVPLTTGATPLTNALVWDAMSKDYTSKAGERYAKFTFHFTNTSDVTVLVHSAQSSCFCTVAKLPATPWQIPAGSNGPIDVTMDLAGKSGRVMKGIFVDTTGGRYNLTVTTAITPPDPSQVQAPTMNDSERLKNMQTALADRQALFKKAECASCHAEPAKGKTDGAQLYAGVCAGCHDSPHRASAVPDLRALNHATDLEHWKHWITYGRAGSMMPAFAQSEGGPLDTTQITVLATYLARSIPSRVVSFPGGGGSGAQSSPPPPLSPSTIAATNR
jgi:mono/diheme cytochrome c family protein